MTALFGNRDVVAREIQGQFRQGTDTIVSPPPICLYFRAKWPLKTAANLAAFANQLGLKSCTERTAARWLSGEHDVPLIVAFAFAEDMVKRK
jgi:hypothetical protein